GYRSGGLPESGGSTAAQFAPFDEEKNLTVEIGSKLDLLERRLRLGAAVYHSKYGDILQSSNMIDPVSQTNVQVTANVGKARVWGAELEAIALLGDLRLSGTLGLTDFKFQEGPLVGSDP